MVIGSDSPIFAMYEDGTVIFARKDDAFKSPRYFSTVLTRDHMEELKADIAFTTLGSMPNNTAAVEITDQPTNILMFSVEGGLEVKTVYGDLRSDTTARNVAPGLFTRVFDRLAQFEETNARPWLPEKVELMLQPFEGSAEPLLWPSEWPGIDSTNSVDRGQLVSLYLPAKYFEQFLSLTKRLKMGQSVLISGRRWHPAYRFPFPKEDIWMR